MKILSVALLASNCWGSCLLRHTCEIFDPAKHVAFVGTPVSSKRLPPNAIYLDGQKRVLSPRFLVTFRVREILSGLPATTRELNVSISGWKFSAVDWLIFGERRGGVIEAELFCGHSNVVEHAGENLAYLRQVRDRTYRATLIIRVLARGESVRRADVKLARHGREWKVAATPWGAFHFDDLEPGKYQLTAAHPDFLALPVQQVELLHHQCATHKVTLVAGSTVTGRATDANGRGISGLVVDLVKSDSAWLSATTSADGEFHFTAVNPGKYTLGTGLGSPLYAKTGPIIAPRCQQEGTIIVSPFRSLNGLELRCSNFGVARQIRVRVVDRRTGRHVARASVFTPWSAQGPNRVSLPIGLTTDSNGWVRVTVMNGAPVELQAVASDRRESQIVKLEKGTGPQILTLKL